MAEPTCPTDCSTNLPVVNFDRCNPNAIASEITKVYIAKPSAIPFEDWSDPEEWADRLSETNVAPVGSTVAVGDLIRPLTVIGDRPAPALVTKEISNQRIKNLRKDFTINFTIDEITPENLAFQRASECGSLVKIWYAIQGGMMFGGLDGIEGNLVMDLVLARGTDEVVAINCVFTWKGKFTEEAIENPIAEAA